MSDDRPTQTGDLGPLPNASIEPKEPNPGGADALPEEAGDEPADLDSDVNPAVDEHATGALEEMKEGEDTDTEATKDGADVPPEEESPA